MSTPSSGAAGMDSQAQFEQLMDSRNDEYEQRRRLLFSNPEGVAYLPKRFDDADRVVAFIARTLHAWATHPLPEYGAFDRFLKNGIQANRARMSRTAVGWQPETELSGYIHADGNRRSTQNYALLHALMRPSAPYVVGGINLYFYSHPVDEPEVLVRINLASPVPGSAEGLATLSLRQIDAARALQALEHERNLALRLQQPFPEELDAMRQALAPALASACMPAVPNDPAWQGITIDTPPLIQTKPGQAAVVLVCGLAVVPIIVPTPPEMRLVAVDIATGQRYAGPVLTPTPQDNAVPNPAQRPPRQADEVAGMAGQVRFDVDLMEVLHLRERPVRPS